MRVRPVAQLCLVLGTLALFVSCIGVETEISFKEDGSGSVVLTYRISRIMVNLGTVEDGELIPLPLTEQDFRATVEAVPGLRLRRVTQRADERDVSIRAEIEFDDIEAFSRIESFTDMPASLDTANDQTVFRQVITSGNEEDYDSESLEMVDVFFDGYSIAFIISAPRDVVSHNLGDLSADKRSVTYDVPVVELLRSAEERILEVSW